MQAVILIRDFFLFFCCRVAFELLKFEQATDLLRAESKSLSLGSKACAI